MAAEPNKSRQLELARRVYPKHNPYSLKPVVRSVIGVGLFVIPALMIDKKYFTHFSMLKLPKSGWFLLSYLIGIFAMRAKEAKTSTICYELLWGCNISLALSSVGCLMGRPLLVGISIGLVTLDQTVWYMDIVSLLLRRKYLIGAAAYLSNPEQTLLRSITSLHHLWFIPFALYTLYRGESYLHNYSLPISMLLGTLSMLYARVMTPKYVWMPTLKREKEIEAHKSHHSIPNILDTKNGHYLEYLNINCGHEFYPGVPLRILHFCNASPVYIYLPITASLLTLTSCVPFVLMKKCSDKYLYVAR
eukprot:16324_1